MVKGDVYLTDLQCDGDEVLTLNGNQVGCTRILGTMPSGTEPGGSRVISKAQA